MTLVSLVFCFAVEFSQLYHAPWIDSVPMVKFQPLIEQVSQFKNAWNEVARIVGEPNDTPASQGDDPSQTMIPAEDCDVI